MGGHRLAVVAVWGGTLLAAIAAAVLPPVGLRPAVLALVLAVSVVAALAVQLAVGEREGFVERLAASVAGSFGVVVLASVAVLAASLAAGA